MGSETAHLDVLDLAVGVLPKFGKLIDDCAEEVAHVEGGDPTGLLDVKQP